MAPHVTKPLLGAEALYYVLVVVELAIYLSSQSFYSR